MSAKSTIGLLLLLTIVAACFGKEIMVFEYCRHGARGSLADLHNNSAWIKEWGVEQLTGNGMRMQFHLGKEIRLRYPSIFDANFNLDHMEAFATNFNRTIASGLSQFTGLFDMFNGPEIPFANDDPRLRPPVLTVDPNVPFRTALPHGYTPIPITSKLNQRKMQIIRDDCPYGNEKALAAKKSLGDYIIRHPKVIDLIRKGAAKYGITDIHDINFKATGTRSLDIDTLFFLGDFTIQDYLHNKHPSIPKTEEGVGINPLYSQLVAAYSLATLSRFNDTEFTTNIISEVLLEIKSLMIKKINDKNYNKRFILYSGHDDMLTAILQAIGYLDPTCLIDGLVAGEDRSCTNTPDLASSMVWELHEEEAGDKKEYFVKIRYNTKFIDFCGLRNQEQDFRCSIAEFSDRLNDVTNKDFKEWCVRGELQKDAAAIERTWKIVTIICLILLILMVGGCGMTTYSLYQKVSNFEEERGLHKEVEGDQYLSIAQKD